MCSSIRPRHPNPHPANRYYRATQIPSAGEGADRRNLKNMCTDCGCENCKKTLGTLPNVGEILFQNLSWAHVLPMGDRPNVPQMPDD